MYACPADTTGNVVRGDPPMQPSKLAQTMPCSLPGRLTVGDLICRVSITRLGGDAAQLSMATPLDVGTLAVLEMDRPTDGARVWIRVRIQRIEASSDAREWKRLADVQLLEFMDRSALTSFSAAPGATEGVDRDSWTVEGVSLSMEDSAEEVPPDLGTPERPPHLSMEQARRIARGAVDLEPAAPLAPDVPTAQGLPAAYRPSLPRRSSATAPWAPTPATPTLRKMQQREPRIISASPVAYLTSGRHRSGLVQDFSRHGMFLAIQDEDPLPLPGATVRVEFPIPSPPSVYMVGLMAEVRWIHGGHRNATPGRGAGVQILTFDSAWGREVYETYVDDLLAGNGGA